MSVAARSLSSALSSAWNIIYAVVKTLYQVAFFWQLRAWNKWRAPTELQLCHEALRNARHFEEWEANAYSIDELLENHLWRQAIPSKHYDYKPIYDRLQAFIDAMDAEDLVTTITLLRAGLVRNYGNIIASRLYTRAHAGTKLVIEDYITQVALAVQFIAHHPIITDGPLTFTSQEKLDVLHDSRQAFGRTALVLQGGSIFGLCHMGVVKALHLRGVLPRIISGSATGALIAALVGVHREDELLEFLSSDGIDLSAFAARSKEAASHSTHSTLKHGWLPTLIRRARRFFEEGYVLDAKALEDCVKANVGDLTFAEAYNKSKRILNITIASPSPDLPRLLNYLTTPNVLIWSAALLSNTPDEHHAQAQLFCKDDAGNVMPWSPRREGRTRPNHDRRFPVERIAPLDRISQLFNVNHFLVSQARPYIAPFLQSDLNSPKPGYKGQKTISQIFLKVVYMEIQHRLRQLDSLGYLSSKKRRFLLDDNPPGNNILMFIPEVGLYDFAKLLENPSRASLDYWILKGERSVWPAIPSLKIRMAVEVELDRGYQLARRRRPVELVGVGHFNLAKVPPESTSRKRKKSRTTSISEGHKEM